MTDEFDTFADSETARMEADRAEAFKGKGLLPLAQMAQGDNHVVFERKIPTDGMGKLNGKKLFEITMNGTKMVWARSPLSPLYREIIALLKAGKLKLVIARVGKGMTDTRYSVREDI